MKCRACIYKDQKGKKYECCLDHKDITETIDQDNKCLFYKDRIYHYKKV